MPSSKLNITEAKVRLSEIVNRVQYNGEIFVIQRYGKDAVVILPLKNLESVDPHKSSKEAELLRTGTE